MKTDLAEDRRDNMILQRGEYLRESLRVVFLQALRGRSAESRIVRTTWRHSSTLHTAEQDAAEVMRELMMNDSVFKRYLSLFTDTQEFRAYEQAAASMYADQYADTLAEIEIDEEEEELQQSLQEAQAADMIEFRRTA